MTTEEALADLLKSRRIEDRIRAVQGLAGTNSATGQALLLQALHDRTPYVAALAAEALGQRAGEDAALAMTERFLTLMEDGLRRDPGCHIRANLAFAFGRLEYTPAAEALRQGIRAVQIEPVGGVPFDTAAHLRANCALALAQIHAPDALRDITLLLFDHGTDAPGAGDIRHIKVEPRKAAARALARLAVPDSVVPLALRLTYPAGETAEVLQECMLAVVALEDPRALELLEPYLKHEDSHLAAYAALMIAQTQAPEAPALIRMVVGRLSGDPLQAAMLALATLRSEEGRAALLELAGDAREAVRLAAAQALAGAQDALSRKKLADLAAHDRSAAVRRTAERALAG
ncbi:MAG TPA: HEAT repeat domain-containing protein [Chthonomonadaceae bacterium]|nr:HEAT repeat domain-containing protein [Chthonomonadaceae bacterium]